VDRLRQDSEAERLSQSSVGRHRPPGSSPSAPSWSSPRVQVRCDGLLGLTGARRRLQAADRRAHWRGGRSCGRAQTPLPASTAECRCCTTPSTARYLSRPGRLSALAITAPAADRRALRNIDRTCRQERAGRGRVMPRRRMVE
jgi:hypothetical protein